MAPPLLGPSRWLPRLQGRPRLGGAALEVFAQALDLSTRVTSRNCVLRNDAEVAISAIRKGRSTRSIQMQRCQAVLYRIYHKSVSM